MIQTRRVLLCTGSGGVGKTTAAAAIAVEAATRGQRVAVLTVDPARRLKDALRLGDLDEHPRAVPIGNGAGHLDAMLLNVKGTFDQLVRTLAADTAQADRILANRLYQNLSTSLIGSAEYMAVETLYRLAHEEDYDLLVVDTPPARHAVDFLDAPRRLVALLDSRAFAILKNPASILPASGSRLASFVLANVLRGLERITGIGLIREIGDFVALIDPLTAALRERMTAVTALLAGPRTAIVLVTSPEPRLAEEAGDLTESLARLGLVVDGVIANRVLPRDLLADAPAAPDTLPADLQRRLVNVHRELAETAARQQATLAPIVEEADAPLLAELPLLSRPPASVDDLRRLAVHLLDPRRPADAVGAGVRSR